MKRKVSKSHAEKHSRTERPINNAYGVLHTMASFQCCFRRVAPAQWANQSSADQGWGLDLERVGGLVPLEGAFIHFISSPPINTLLFLAMKCLKISKPERPDGMIRYGLGL